MAEQRRPRQPKQQVEYNNYPPQYYQPPPQVVLQPPDYTPPPQPHYSLTQILGGIVGIISIAGAMIGTYVSLINKITEQSTSYSLTTVQTTKDFEEIRNAIKELRSDVAGKDKELQSKVDFIQAQNEATVEKLVSKIEDLSTSVDSLYNRIQQPQPQSQSRRAN